ncbi:MAG: AraC family transcriptional regulator [Planctomycetota bacterium]
MDSIKSTNQDHDSGQDAAFDTLRPPDARRVWAATARVRGDVVRHDHDYFEIALVAAGRAQHRTLYDQSPLGPGDLMLLPPGTWHGYADADQLVVRNGGFRPDLLRRELAWLMGEPRLATLLWQRPAGDHAPSLTLARLDLAAFEAAEQHAARLESLGPAQHVAAVAALVALLDLLAEAAAPQLDGRDTPPPHRAVVEAAALFAERYAEPWTLPRIARAVHVEPSYLTRLFTLHAGRSPMAYLARLRLERAAALLLRGDLPVAAVGQRVGLDDPNYFARRFRQHFGQSPSRFRATRKQP